MNGHRAALRQHPAVLVLAVVLVIATPVLVLIQTASASATAAAHRDQARWAALIGAVHPAHMALEDELNVLAATALADPDSPAPTGDDVTGAGRDRARSLADLLGMLDDLAADPTLGSLAQQLTEVYRPLPADPDEIPVMADVLGVTDQAEQALGSLAPDGPAGTALVQLMVQTSIPRLVVNDVLDASYLQGGQRAASWTDGYFDGAEYYLDGNGGWIDLDADGQLTSPYLTATALRADLPQVWAQLRQVMDVPAAAPLLAADGWIQDWSATAAAAEPATLQEVRTAAAIVSADVAALVADTTATMAAEDQAAAADAQRRTALLGVAGALVVLAALVVAVRAGRHQWGRVAAWRSGALTDPLTGLANRRALQAFAGGTSGSADTGCLLLLIDLDHFKAINDRFGHAVGDQALSDVAARVLELAQAIPHRAMAARIGGDEFVILATDVPDPGPAAELAATALTRSVSQLRVEAAGQAISLSVTVGVAAAPGAPPLEELLTGADERLYDHRGRDVARRTPSGGIEAPAADRQPA